MKLTKTLILANFVAVITATPIHADERREEVDPVLDLIQVATKMIKCGDCIDGVHYCQLCSLRPQHALFCAENPWPAECQDLADLFLIGGPVDHGEEMTED